MRFEQAKNPEGELCRDDTLSPTELVNVPVARFTDTIKLNGRLMSEQDLQRWANTYTQEQGGKGVMGRSRHSGSSEGRPCLASAAEDIPKPALAPS